MSINYMRIKGNEVYFRSRRQKENKCHTYIYLLCCNLNLLIVDMISNLHSFYEGSMYTVPIIMGEVVKCV